MILYVEVPYFLSKTFEFILPAHSSVTVGFFCSPRCVVVVVGSHGYALQSYDVVFGLVPIYLINNKIYAMSHAQRLCRVICGRNVRKRSSTDLVSQW